MKRYNMERIKITPEEADRLLERYYEGATTNEEERLIRIFLASPAAGSSRYDADKAVMGYLCTKRARRKSVPAALKWIPAAAAACIILTVGLLTYGSPDTPDCIAYIGGTECTNEATVMAHLTQTMQDVGSDTGTLTMESQMKAVFGTNTDK